MTKRLKWGVTAVVLLMFLVLALQNTRVVTLDAFAWEVQLSLIIPLIVSLALGFVLGFAMAKISSAAKRRRQASRTENGSGE